MELVRIRNLKSINDSGDIYIRPLTVLIGKNSSGKSTLLRLFPLMKQTLTSRLSEPLLWFGDLVDFGSFENSISSWCSQENDCIIFEFGLNAENIFYDFINGSSCNAKIRVKIEYKKDRVKTYTITVDNKNTIRMNVYSKWMDIKKYKIYVNDIKVDEKYLYGEDNGWKSSVFPTIKSKDTYSHFSFLSRRRYAYPRKVLLTNFFNDEQLDRAKQYLFESYGQNTVREIFREAKIEDIRIACLDFFLDEIETLLSSELQNAQYFEPLRARGDRFYRVQGLSSSEVDSNGHNTAMVLYGMSKLKLKEFENWCNSNFGFSYSIVKNGSENASIVVKNALNNEQYNLTDTGFGYSQILPILISIWKESGSRGSGSGIYNSADKIIVIEQPELHLHPAFQRKLLNSIINIIKSDLNIKFIIETHSETIINSIGKAIYEKRIANESVNLSVVNKIEGRSRFSSIAFDESGVLKDWPIGFFSDEDI